jgi:hypothetical protein
MSKCAAERWSLSSDSELASEDDMDRFGFDSSSEFDSVMSVSCVISSDRRLKIVSYSPLGLRYSAV